METMAGKPGMVAVLVKDSGYHVSAGANVHDASDYQRTSHAMDGARVYYVDASFGSK